MHAPASRRQPSARSRMLSSTRSSRARRGLGDVVSGVVHGVSVVVHDASDVVHDVGHAVSDALSGQVSNLPGDVVKTGFDFVKTGKDVVEVIHSPPNLSAGHDSGSGSGSGDQSHTGGGDGGAQPHPAPHPTAVPGSGGGEVAVAPLSSPASSEDPTSAAPPLSSTSRSSEYTASAPSTSAKPVTGAMDVVPNPSSGHQPAEPMYPHEQNSAVPTDSQAANGMQPSSSVSATQSSTTMRGALPGNGSGDAHRKGFPLAAAAALGAVVGFLVVSALFWAVWIYLRKRRRAFHVVYLPPRRMLSVTSGRTVSTVPLFISASEAGVKDDSKSNPFRHPLDVHEDDPFDAASLWRSSTTRSASTLSV